MLYLINIKLSILFKFLFILIAPEIITGEGHGKAADWWSLGILM